VSLLAGLPEVDAGRIGVTGISWGGYLTCIVAGLDDRPKVAVPVYGCGFLHQNSAWLPTLQKMPEARRKAWMGHFDPSRYVGRAAMPVLFVNGTNDFAYPLDSSQQTYRLVKDRQLGVKVNLPHSHPAGWAPVEISLFVDQHLRGGSPLARVEAMKRDGKKVEVRVRSAVVILLDREAGELGQMPSEAQETSRGTGIGWSGSVSRQSGRVGTRSSTPSPNTS
jgi:dienelactone hydrolase